MWQGRPAGSLLVSGFSEVAIRAVAVGSIWIVEVDSVRVEEIIQAE